MTFVGHTKPVDLVRTSDDAIEAMDNLGLLMPPGVCVVHRYFLNDDPELLERAIASVDLGIWEMSWYPKSPRRDACLSMMNGMRSLLVGRLEEA